jgi:hypothetical protein
MRRARGALATVLAVVAVGMTAVGMTQAGAAQLTLAGGQHPHVSSFVRCDAAVDVSTQPAQSTPTTSSSVQVANIDPACAGRPLSVIVYNPTTGAIRAPQLGPVTVPAGGGSLTVPTANFAPSATDRATVTIDTWPVTATWTYVPPYWCTVVSGGSTGATCTATVTLFTGIKPGGTLSATYYDVVVQTTSATALTWEVGFNLLSSFYGGVPTRLGNSTLDGYSDGLTTWDGTPANNVTTQGTCSAGQLRVRGASAGPANNKFETVSSARQRQFSLVVNRTEVGYNDVLSAGCP